MAKVTTNINLDENLKREAKELFIKFGLRHEDLNHHIFEAKHMVAGISIQTDNGSGTFQRR